MNTNERQNSQHTIVFHKRYKLAMKFIRVFWQSVSMRIHRKKTNGCSETRNRYIQGIYSRKKRS